MRDAKKRRNRKVEPKRHITPAATTRMENTVATIQCETRIDLLDSDGNGARDIHCGNERGTTVCILAANGKYRVK